MRTLLWVGVGVAALSVARPHLRRLLDVEHTSLIGTTSSARETPLEEEHFAPWEDLERLDVAELQKADQSIDIAMYSFTDRRLAEVLRDLAARRIRIRIYRDQAQYVEEERAAARTREPSTTQMLRGQPNIQVRVKQGPERDLMHQKEFCVDDRLLRDGSANWSRGGLRVQDNNAHYSSDRKDVDRFERVFEAMWTRRNNLVVQ